VVTIAVGIGFNAANFSVVHKLLLRPLELHDMDTLVSLQEKRPQDVQFEDSLAPRVWLDLEEQTHSYQSIGAWWYEELALTGVGLPEQIMGSDVTPAFFSTLGVPAALGRTFAPDEVDGKNDHVAVLSDALWKVRFGADPNILGRHIELDGASYTIVGVMPKSFA